MTGRITERSPPNRNGIGVLGDHTLTLSLFSLFLPLFSITLYICLLFISVLSFSLSHHTQSIHTKYKYVTRPRHTPTPPDSPNILCLPHTHTPCVNPSFIPEMQLLRLALLSSTMPPVSPQEGGGGNERWREREADGTKET